MTGPVRIAMWSGPRNMSTTMMRSFGARADTYCTDEPFYAAWLVRTGTHHPMQEEILASQSHDMTTIQDELIAAPPPGKTVHYQKHMTHHMDGNFSLGWARGFHHVFLIRHPARVIASYQRKMKQLSISAIGFPQQAELFAEATRIMGRAPAVIDSDRVLKDPESVLKRLCQTIGIGWDPAMLHWPEGDRQEDGAWAPHWYDAVRASTGFGQPPGPLPTLTGAAAAIEKEALAIYERLLQAHV